MVTTALEQESAKWKTSPGDSSTDGLLEKVELGVRLSRDAPRSFLIEQSDMNTHGHSEVAEDGPCEDRRGKGQRKTSSWRELFLPKQQPEVRSGTEPMAHLAAILASCDEEAARGSSDPPQEMVAIGVPQRPAGAWSDPHGRQA